MTDPSTPVPAEQAVQQASVTALAEDHVAPTHFIPQATQDNYAQIARDRAQAQGVEPRQVMQELADQWQQLHERQPLDGYDHLAAWGRDFDPAAGGAPTGLAILQARTLESARRDPQQAVIGDQANVEQAVASQHALDEGTIGVTHAPTIGDAGLLPGGGPLPIPPDLQPTVDPAVAEQQQAAAQQREPGEQFPSGDTASTPPPPPAPEPAPEPSPPPSSSKSSKSSSS